MSSGVSQLEFLDKYYKEMANSKSEEESEENEDVVEAYQEQSLAESEEMAEAIEAAVAQYGLRDQVEVDFMENMCCST